MNYAQLATVCNDGTIHLVIDGFHEIEQVLPFMDVLGIKVQFYEPGEIHTRPEAARTGLFK